MQIARRSLGPEEVIRMRALNALRQKHGFRHVTDSRNELLGDVVSTAATSRQKLEAGVEVEINGRSRVLQRLTENEAKETEQPRNVQFLEAARERFEHLGFRWELKRCGEVTVNGKNGQSHTRAARQWVEFRNYPTVGGTSLTLFDLLVVPLELVDGALTKQAIHHLVEQVGTHATRMNDVKGRMSETGIGYSGIEGVSWRALVEPFQFPRLFKDRLTALGSALFLFFDAIREVWKSDPTLVQLLTHKAPDRIPRLMESGTVDIIRPDIVVVRDPDGTLRPVVTELESCPAGQGMTHAMQFGYGLKPDMVDVFARYLAGRPLLVLATNQWAEYVWDQAAFCRALRERGVDARVLFDAPLDEIHRRVQDAWKPPQAAPAFIKERWNPNFLERLSQRGFREFVGGARELPEDVGRAVVYRFGYFDNFDRKIIERMIEWQRAGASIVNPLQFCLESKALMAARSHPAVRAWIQARDERALTVLDQCLAETHLLGAGFSALNALQHDQQHLLTKFAAWDGNNQSWGSRSLCVGSQESGDAWRKSLETRMQLPHPVVAQHVIVSALFDAAYVEGNNTIVEALQGARTRLTPFFVRVGGEAVHAGSTLTLRAGTFRIHGATDAVEGPVVFAN